MKIGRKIRLGIALAAVMAVVAVPTAFAMTNPGDEVELDEAVELDLGAEMQAEADAIAAALDEAGIEYELVTVAWPVFDAENDEVWEVIETALDDLYERFDDKDIDGEAADPGAEMQAEAAAVAAALDEAGIEYELVSVAWPVFDEKDEAAWDVVDSVFEELDGELYVEEIDFGAELQAEAEAIAAALDEAGVEYETVTIEWPVFDAENDDAWEIVDEALMDLYGDDEDIDELDDDEDLDEDGDDDDLDDEEEDDEDEDEGSDD